MLYQTDNTNDCANDNPASRNDSLLDMLVGQDMFSPEKALEILQLLMPKEPIAEIKANIIS